MYARVARFKNANPSDIDVQAQAVRENTRNAAAGEPSGVPQELTSLVRRLVMLADRGSGESVMITFFATEDDAFRGDRLLNDMTPQGSGMGRRTSVEIFEVVLDESPAGA